MRSAISEITSITVMIDTPAQRPSIPPIDDQKSDRVMEGTCFCTTTVEISKININMKEGVVYPVISCSDIFSSNNTIIGCLITKYGLSQLFGVYSIT